MKIEYTFAILLFIVLFLLYSKKKFIGGYLKNKLLKYLHKNNIPVNTAEKTFYYKGKNINYELQYLNNNTSCYNLNNKVFIKYILKQHNYPAINYILVNKKLNKDKIQNSINKYNLQFPVVLKPINGQFGNNIKMDIPNIDVLYETLNSNENKSNKNNYNEFLVEEQQEGVRMRILVIKNEIDYIAITDKPFIIGDGINTIENLLIIENNKRKKKIVPDYDMLNRNNINKDTVLEKDKKIIVNSVSNTKQGSNVLQIIKDPKKINEFFHIDNINMFKNINKIFDTKINGIDFITTNPKKSYKDGFGYILELNCGPDTAHSTIKNTLFDKLYT